MCGRRRDSPLFVEMMDKRFLIILNPVNYLVLPPANGFEESTAIAMRKIIGELIAVSLPDAVLVAYAKTCETAHRTDLDAVFPVPRRWVHDPGPWWISRHPRPECRRHHRRHRGFGRARRPSAISAASGQERHRSLDIDAAGLSALTRDAVLIHDEHMLFGDILSDAEHLMEHLSEQDVLPALENADCKLREHAELAFASLSSFQGCQAHSGLNSSTVSGALVSAPVQKSAMRCRTIQPPTRLSRICLRQPTIAQRGAARRIGPQPSRARDGFPVLKLDPRPRLRSSRHPVPSRACAL